MVHFGTVHTLLLLLFIEVICYCIWLAHGTTDLSSSGSTLHASLQSSLAWDIIDAQYMFSTTYMKKGITNKHHPYFGKHRTLTFPHLFKNFLQQEACNRVFGKALQFTSERRVFLAFFSLALPFRNEGGSYVWGPCSFCHWLLLFYHHQLSLFLLCVLHKQLKLKI